ncbi:anion permease [bacterium]|nr:anion permease [bacterium]
MKQTRFGKTFGFLLGITLFLTGVLTPPPAGMAPEAWRMAGVALLMACWWISEAAPIAVVALLPLVLFPVLRIMPAKETATAFGDDMIFLFLGGFMIASALERCGLHRRIALFVIRLIGSGPPRVVFGFMLATALLSMWISNTATTLMMLPMALAVARQLYPDEAPESPAAREFGQALMLGLAYAASIGGVATLIGTPPNIVFSGFFHSMYPGAPRITFAGWMLFGLPFSAAMLPIAWGVVTRKLRKLDPSAHAGHAARDVIRREIDALGAMTSAERRVGAIFLVTAAAWMFRAPMDFGGFRIPGWSGVLPEPAWITDGTVAIFMGVLLFLVPSGVSAGGDPGDAGGRLLSWKSFETRAPWGVLLLFGGGFALAKGFTATGLSEWIGAGVAGLSAVPTPLLVVIVCLAMTFLTEVTSNTATATMIMPILGAAAASLGKNPILLMAPAAVSASCAFMLPVATPPNAVVFGSGRVSIPAMARAGFVLNIAGVAVVTLLLYLLGGAAFGIDFRALPAWAH